MHLPVKEYYRKYLADDNLSELNKNLIEEILKFKPVSVFEFGSGTGKNLKFIQALDREIFVSGIDVSYINTIHAMVKNGLDHVSLGDEQDLKFIANYDVCITVSVLDHIKDIQAIIYHLKRIAAKAVVIAECTEHQPENFYWAHRYQDYGFRKIKGSEMVSDGDGKEYAIYVFSKVNANDDLAN